MLEQFCAQGRSIIVAKTKKPRKKVNKNKMAKEQQPTLPTKSLDERWDEVGPELSAVMQEGTIPDVVPFDAASDVPIDDQKSDTMKRIQRLMRRKKFEEAVGLLRSARDRWLLRSQSSHERFSFPGDGRVQSCNFFFDIKI
ncbi:hypothetical protein PV325_004746 [Microctonus aethiopoides]|nr:hypothetical protein PV325_004746 [Microctonus aethiopoides]